MARITWKESSWRATTGAMAPKHQFQEFRVVVRCEQAAVPSFNEDKKPQVISTT
jgi:hypothetical protein